VVGEILLREILAARPFIKGNLLDIGCGKRPYSLVYDSLVENSVGTEVEFSPHGIVAADVICFGEALPFKPSCFDTVLCTEVLEHTKKPFQVINEVTRVLKPGGTLILSVPFIYPLHEAPNDYWRFTPHGLEIICNSLGLTPIYIRSKGGVGATIFSLGANLVVRLVNAISKLLRIHNPPLRDYKMIRWLIALPQWIYLWISKRTDVPSAVKELDYWLSPGYIILASRIEYPET
jgi:SAM-dependent methyltransferase